MFKRFALVLAFALLSFPAIAGDTSHMWVYSTDKPSAPSDTFYAYSTVVYNGKSEEDENSREVSVKFQVSPTKSNERVYSLTCEKDGLAFDLSERSNIAIPEKEVRENRVTHDHRDLVNAWFAVCRKENNKVPVTYKFIEPPFSFYCNKKGKCITSRFVENDMVGGNTHRVLVSRDEDKKQRELILDCDFNTYYDVAQPRQGMINVHPDRVDIDRISGNRDPGFFEGVNAWWNACRSTSQKIKTESFGSKVK